MVIAMYMYNMITCTCTCTTCMYTCIIAMYIMWSGVMVASVLFPSPPVYPEPVYSVEKELTPRQKKQIQTRQRKASHYRVM